MIRIGTRGSELALKHANTLVNQIAKLALLTSSPRIKTINSKTNIETVVDTNQNYFSREETERALINHDIDVAIHELSALPTAQTEGLVIAGVSDRASVNDVLVVKKKYIDQDQNLNLKEGAIIGLSSYRRKSFLKNLSPTVRIKDITGNTSERLQKLSGHDIDGIILAKGHINDLGIDLSNYHVQVLNPIEFVPAPAQGVYAYQTRKDDIETRKIIHQIHNSNVSSLTNVERTVLKLFGENIQLALGIYCMKDANSFYHCYGMYTDSLDHKPTFHRISQSTSHKLAERMYQALSKNYK